MRAIPYIGIFVLLWGCGVENSRDNRSTARSNASATQQSLNTIPIRAGWTDLPVNDALRACIDDLAKRNIKEDVKKARRTGRLGLYIRRTSDPYASLEVLGVPRCGTKFTYRGRPMPEYFLDDVVRQNGRHDLVDACEYSVENYASLFDVEALREYGELRHEACTNPENLHGVEDPQLYDVQGTLKRLAPLYDKIQ